MNATWITVRTAAKILNVSHNTIRAMIERNELPVVGYVDNRIVVLDRLSVERVAERRDKQAVA